MRSNDCPAENGAGCLDATLAGQRGRGYNGGMKTTFRFIDQGIDLVAQILVGLIQVTLLIPHELLHILGYRLVGKRCLYRWGDAYVTPLGPVSRRERLVGALFPFVTSLSLGVISMGLFGIASALARQAMLHSEISQSHIFWMLFFAGLWVFSGMHMGMAANDLRNAYRWLRQQPTHDPQNQTNEK